MNPSKPELIRLHQILADEQYGPALVRLPVAQQRGVLDLIERNQMRRAREEIERFDQQRRSQETENRQHRRQRQVHLHIVVELREEEVEYSEVTIASGVAMMTRTEYTDTMTWDGAEIRDMARDRGHIRYAPLLGKFRNPWWYH
jgi:hypothetical protein